MLEDLGKGKQRLVSQHPRDHYSDYRWYTLEDLLSNALAFPSASSGVTNRMMKKVRFGMKMHRHLTNGSIQWVNSSAVNNRARPRQIRIKLFYIHVHLRRDAIPNSLSSYDASNGKVISVFS